MSAPIAWAALAGALLVLPARPGDQLPAAAERRPRSATDYTPGGPRAGRRQAVVAAVAVAAACVAAFGPRTGLGVAVLAAPTTAIALARLPQGARPVVADRELALALDLAAAALRAGRSLADALTLAAPAAAPDTAGVLRAVAGRSRLGADAAQAWAGRPRDGPLAELAEVAIRSASSGSKLAGAFERLAGEIRSAAAAAAAVRAQRAGIAALGPLAACFLPSFVCLGVVPVVVGMARATFGGLS